MEQILLNDFKRLPAPLKAELNRVMAEVLDSGWYILGERLKSFEKAWAKYCGVAHAVGVANGMDAIEIGLQTLSLRPGDEVITTPLTAFATVLGIIRAGAVPVLADIDADTGLLDVASAARCVSPRTKAVLLVHLYGQIRDMDRWTDFCTAHQLLLLEDAAQAHGAEWHGQRAGTFGAWAAYSFYPTKNLGAFGDGGALCTNRQNTAVAAASFRNYGQSERYHHPTLGSNSRLDEIQAAILEVLLRELPTATTKRREIATRYHAELNSSVVFKLAAPQTTTSHAYHLYVVRSRARAELQRHLTTKAVQTLIHYPVCVHHQPPCAHLGRDPNGLRSAETFAEECLSLPCHPYLTDDEVTRVVAAVNSFSRV
ncbi:MAG: DegT/DnrJ/EryC1/StrS family aminotransferase [Opitutus sp.]